MREQPKPRPRDDKDAAQDIARDLAEIASHIAQPKAEARTYLQDPNYNTLKLREWRRRTRQESNSLAMKSNLKAWPRH